MASLNPVDRYYYTDEDGDSLRVSVYSDGDVTFNVTPRGGDCGHAVLLGRAQATKLRKWLKRTLAQTVQS